MMPWRHRRRSRASQREGVQAGGVRGARRAGGDGGGGDEGRRTGHEEEKQCRSSHGCVVVGETFGYSCLYSFRRQRLGLFFSR